MNPNRMTGEPSQQNPTSVFGFDSYPPLFGVNWNQSNPFTNNIQYETSENQHQVFSSNPGLFPSTFNSSPVTSPLPTSMPSEQNPFGNQLSGFSFGTARPQQEIVHFPFQNTNTGFGTRELGCKRKTDSPPLQQVKQHITEEKMAEHMSKLHISSETASPKENDTGRMQRLYMCEEMRKLQTESILPQTLLSKIQMPCTALVLWKPPTRLIPPIGNNDVVAENENNNRDSVPDHNKLENSGIEAEMNEDSMNTMDLDAC